MEKDHDRDGIRRGGGMGRESSKLCQAVLGDLITLDGDGWFLDPVDPVEMEIPDYVEVVKEPMDLGTVRSRLEGGEYEAADAFARDIRLTFTNAMRYNEAPDHVVHIAASSLLKAFNERYEAWFTTDGKVREKPPIQPPSPEPTAGENGATKPASKQGDGKQVHAFFRPRRRAAEGTKVNDSSAVSDAGGAERGKGKEVGAGAEGKKARKRAGPLRDEELLKTEDFFLNPDQRRRKAQLLQEKKIEEDSKRRREEITAFNRGRELHPFFTNVTLQVAAAANAPKPAPEDAIPWFLPLFPSVPHVTQSLPTEREGGGSLQGLLAEAADRALGLEEGKGEGTERGVEVVDLSEEEAEVDDPLRAVLLDRLGLASPVDDPDATRGRGLIPLWLESNRGGSLEETVTELGREMGLTDQELREHLQRARKLKAAGAATEQWVDKYRPRDVQGLVGDQQVAAHELERWLGEWERLRQQSSGGRSKAKRRRRRSSESSDEDFEDSDAEADHGPVFSSSTLVLGPPGSGKTAMVYAVAESRGFQVIEVNPSQGRSGTEIKKLLSEATQSQHISAGQSSFATSVFKQQRGGGKVVPVEDSDASQDAEVVVLEPAGHGGSASSCMVLILVEEVDVVFEEDTGFSRALRELMSSAKWPLVLTANECPRWLKEGECRVHVLHRPPTERLAVLLASIWAMEGGRWGALPHRLFTELAMWCDGDMRSAIMSLQLWADRLPSKCCTGQGHTPSTAASQQSAPTPTDSLLGYRFPAVRHVRPLTGPIAGGTRLRVQGQNFLQQCADGQPGYADAEVLVGTQQCNDVVILSDSCLEAVVPPSWGARPGLQPVVVRLCGMVSSEALKDQASRGVFSYRDDNQPRIDELMLLPHQRKRRLQRKEADSEEGEVEEIEDTPIKQGGGGGGADAEAEEEEEEDKTAGGQTKRRRIVLESEDEGEEREREGGDEDKEGEAGQGLAEAAGLVSGVADPAMEEEPIQSAEGQAGEPEERQELQQGKEETRDMLPPAEALDRVYRRVLRRPAFGPECAATEAAGVADLASCMEALSLSYTLDAGTMPLDGDLFVQPPCSSHSSHRGVTQDLEASTWPATAAEIASTLLGLTNKLYMGVEATSTRLRGHEEIDPLRLTQAARTLKKNNTLGLETVLPVLAPPNRSAERLRRDVMLDLLPTIRYIYHLDQLNVGSMSGRRRQSKGHITGSLGLVLHTPQFLAEAFPCV